MSTLDAELSRLLVMMEALDRAVRSSRVLPDRLAERWRDFYGRWLSAASVISALGRGQPGRPSGEYEEWVTWALRWRDALARWGVHARGVHVGFDGFISPSRARARMDSVNAEVDTLDAHVVAQRQALGEPFVEAWGRWRDTWRAFYGRYDRDWDWWYLGNGSAWNETLTYQERLGHWRRAAERAGAHFTTPAPQSAPERRQTSDWAGSARDIAVAGAIGAAALGAVYLVSKVS